jgi:hypothetical protein
MSFFARIAIRRSKSFAAAMSAACPVHPVGRKSKRFSLPFSEDPAHREAELPPQVAAGELNPAAAVAERRMLGSI